MSKCIICSCSNATNPRKWLDGQIAYVCTECTESTKPIIVCLCGSTRFYEEFAKANLELTLQGAIVLSIGCDTHHIDATYTTEQKQALDRLHKYKIRIADEILVLNKDGYIGPSTRSEIDYALYLGKTIRYRW